MSLANAWLHTSEIEIGDGLSGEVPLQILMGGPGFRSEAVACCMLGYSSDSSMLREHSYDKGAEGKVDTAVHDR